MKRSKIHLIASSTFYCFWETINGVRSCFLLMTVSPFMVTHIPVPEIILDAMECLCTYPHKPQLTHTQKPTISQQPWPPLPSPTEPFQQHPGHDNAPTDSYSPLLPMVVDSVFNSCWFSVGGPPTLLAVLTMKYQPPSTTIWG